MASGVFGGGLIFVVAALLWVAVLVPSWVRRREFRTAEQNALRLQRTLRVLAETAEVPTEVRVEATAREALAQERLLRTAQRQQDAERKVDQRCDQRDHPRAAVAGEEAGDGGDRRDRQHQRKDGKAAHRKFTMAQLARPTRPSSITNAYP